MTGALPYVPHGTFRQRLAMNFSVQTKIFILSFLLVTSVASQSSNLLIENFVQRQLLQDQCDNADSFAYISVRVNELAPSYAAIDAFRVFAASLAQQNFSSSCAQIVNTTACVPYTHGASASLAGDGAESVCSFSDNTCAPKEFYKWDVRVLSAICADSCVEQKGLSFAFCAGNVPIDADSYQRAKRLFCNNTCYQQQGYLKACMDTIQPHLNRCYDLRLKFAMAEGVTYPFLMNSILSAISQVQKEQQQSFKMSLQSFTGGPHPPRRPFMIDLSLANSTTFWQPSYFDKSIHGSPDHFFTSDAPQLHMGLWTKCPATCGISWQTRAPLCESQPGYLDRSVNCIGDRDVQLYKICESASECAEFQWQMSPWNSCKGRCGGGYATRRARCIAVNGTIVKDTLCTQAKPPLSTQCNMGQCVMHTWLVGKWTKCSATCGGGFSVRPVICVDNRNHTVDDSNCGISPKNFTACNIQPCQSKKCDNTTDCSGNGMCKDGACFCYKGFKGYNCEVPTTCKSFVVDKDNKCCESGVVDIDGVCHTKPGRLDSRGNFCADGTPVDACGVCEGPAQAVDSAGTCQAKSLDAAGAACKDGIVDECGVCGGLGNSCALVISLNVTTNPRAAVAPNGVKFARAMMSRMLALAGVASKDNSSSNILVADRGWKLENIETISTVIDGVIYPPFLYSTNGSISVGSTQLRIAQMLPWTFPYKGQKIKIIAPLLVNRRGVCGNGVCEIGERPIIGRNMTTFNATNDTLASEEPFLPCPKDCPLPYMPCPTEYGRVCSGNGYCMGNGACTCFTGYHGPKCAKCATGFKFNGRQCVYDTINQARLKQLLPTIMTDMSKTPSPPDYYDQLPHIPEPGTHIDQNGPHTLTRRHPTPITNTAQAPLPVEPQPVPVLQRHRNKDNWFVAFVKKHYIELTVSVVALLIGLVVLCMFLVRRRHLLRMLHDDKPFVPPAKPSLWKRMFGKGARVDDGEQESEGGPSSKDKLMGGDVAGGSNLGDDNLIVVIDAKKNIGPPGSLVKMKEAQEKAKLEEEIAAEEADRSPQIMAVQGMAWLEQQAQVEHASHVMEAPLLSMATTGVEYSSESSSSLSKAVNQTSSFLMKQWKTQQNFLHLVRKPDNTEEYEEAARQQSWDMGISNRLWDLLMPPGTMDWREEAEAEKKLIAAALSSAPINCTEQTQPAEMQMTQLPTSGSELAQGSKQAEVSKQADAGSKQWGVSKLAGTKQSGFSKLVCGSNQAGSSKKADMSKKADVSKQAIVGQQADINNQATVGQQADISKQAGGSQQSGVSKLNAVSGGDGEMAAAVDRANPFVDSQPVMIHEITPADQEEDRPLVSSRAPRPSSISTDASASQSSQESSFSAKPCPALAAYKSPLDTSTSDFGSRSNSTTGNNPEPAQLLQKQGSGDKDAQADATPDKDQHVSPAGRLCKTTQRLFSRFTKNKPKAPAVPSYNSLPDASPIRPKAIPIDESGTPSPEPPSTPTQPTPTPDRPLPADNPFSNTSNHSACSFTPPSSPPKPSAFQDSIALGRRIARQCSSNRSSASNSPFCSETNPPQPSTPESPSATLATASRALGQQAGQQEASPSLLVLKRSVDNLSGIRPAPQELVRLYSDDVGHLQSIRHDWSEDGYDAPFAAHKTIPREQPIGVSYNEDSVEMGTLSTEVITNEALRASEESSQTDSAAWREELWKSSERKRPAAAIGLEVEVASNYNPVTEDTPRLPSAPFTHVVLDSPGAPQQPIRPTPRADQPADPRRNAQQVVSAAKELLARVGSPFSGVPRSTPTSPLSPNPEGAQPIANAAVESRQMGVADIEGQCAAAHAVYVMRAMLQKGPSTGLELDASFHTSREMNTSPSSAMNVSAPDADQGAFQACQEADAIYHTTGEVDASASLDEEQQRLMGWLDAAEHGQHFEQAIAAARARFMNRRKGDDELMAMGDGDSVGGSVSASVGELAVGTASAQGTNTETRGINTGEGSSAVGETEGVTLVSQLVSQPSGVSQLVSQPSGASQLVSQPSLVSEASLVRQVSLASEAEERDDESGRMTPAAVLEAAKALLAQVPKPEVPVIAPVRTTAHKSLSTSQASEGLAARRTWKVPTVAISNRPPSPTRIISPQLDIHNPLWNEGLSPNPPSSCSGTPQVRGSLPEWVTHPVAEHDEEEEDEEEEEEEVTSSNPGPATKEHKTNVSLSGWGTTKQPNAAQADPLRTSASSLTTAPTGIIYEEAAMDDASSGTPTVTSPTAGKARPSTPIATSPFTVPFTPANSPEVTATAVTAPHPADVINSGNAASSSAFHSGSATSSSAFHSGSATSSSAFHPGNAPSFPSSPFQPGPTPANSPAITGTPASQSSTPATTHRLANASPTILAAAFHSVAPTPANSPAVSEHTLTHHTVTAVAPTPANSPAVSAYPLTHPTVTAVAISMTPPPAPKPAVIIDLSVDAQEPDAPRIASPESAAISAASYDSPGSAAVGSHVAHEAQQLARSLAGGQGPPHYEHGSTQYEHGPTQYEHGSPRYEHGSPRYEHGSPQYGDVRFESISALAADVMEGNQDGGEATSRMGGEPLPADQAFNIVAAQLVTSLNAGSGMGAPQQGAVIGGRKAEFPNPFSAPLTNLAPADQAFSWAAKDLLPTMDPPSTQFHHQHTSANFAFEGVHSQSSSSSSLQAIQEPNTSTLESNTSTLESNTSTLTQNSLSSDPAPDLALKHPDPVKIAKSPKKSVSFAEKINSFIPEKSQPSTPEKPKSPMANMSPLKAARAAVKGVASIGAKGVKSPGSAVLSPEAVVGRTGSGSLGGGAKKLAMMAAAGSLKSGAAKSPAKTAFGSKAPAASPLKGSATTESVSKIAAGRAGSLSGSSHLRTPEKAAVDTTTGTPTLSPRTSRLFAVTPKSKK